MVVARLQDRRPPRGGEGEDERRGDDEASRVLRGDFLAALPTLQVPQDGVRQKPEAPNVAEPRLVEATLLRGSKTDPAAAPRIPATPSRSHAMYKAERLRL